MSLRQVVYLSSATQPFSEAMLVALLEGARARNAANAITGILLYAEQDFLQVLEGSPDAVEALLARIRRDKRHRGLIVVHDRPAASRDFSEWAMGYRPADDSEIAAVRGMRRLDPRFFATLAASMRDPAARVFVRQFGDAASR